MSPKILKQLFNYSLITSIFPNITPRGDAKIVDSAAACDIITPHCGNGRLCAFETADMADNATEGLLKGRVAYLSLRDLAIDAFVRKVRESVEGKLISTNDTEQERWEQVLAVVRCANFFSLSFSILLYLK
jgi:hypothetical protein